MREGDGGGGGVEGWGGSTPKRYSLAKLVAGMRPENRRSEIDFGAPAGREFPNGYEPNPKRLRTLAPP